MNEQTQYYTGSQQYAAGRDSNACSGSERRPGVDWTKPLQTVRGLPAKSVYTEQGRRPENDSRIAAITEDGEETCFHFFENGRYYYDGSDSPHDLVNAPEERWRNLYAAREEDGSLSAPRWGAGIFASREEAVKTAERQCTNWETDVLLATVNLAKL